MLDEGMNKWGMEKKWINIWVHFPSPSAKEVFKHCISSILSDKSFHEVEHSVGNGT